MKSIENRYCVGAPHSAMRYWHAHRICADCLQNLPNDDIYPKKYRALQLPPPMDFASYRGTCYVCENVKHVACVEAISERMEGVTQ